MLRLDLNGTWALTWCNEGVGEEWGWARTGVPPDRRTEAHVPGDVHMDMVQAGLADEPLYGMNVEDCKWMDDKDWWYSRTFSVAAGGLGDRTELRFDGLDTTADVWLNGAYVGSSGNALVPHTFDVTQAVRPGENLLVVRVDNGLRSTRGKDLAAYAMHGPGNLEPRVWIRKPQFTFGWDWAPWLPTCGIWRGVQLCSYRKAALRDVFLRSSIAADGAAHVEVLAEVENVSDARVRALVEVTLSRSDQERSVALDGRLEPGLHALHGRLVMPQAALWWPAPMGEPALYDVTAVLSIGDERADERSFRYGIRQVALVQEDLGEEGRSFVIAVNGERVFCKGANWVPADSVMARVGPSKYHALVDAAAEASFSMFRVWGGGVYEDDAFYRLCDEHGILIWQDFMFACAYYPDDNPDFLAEVRAEAEKAVRRLRNHACLALWCGNNENQTIHQQRVQSGQATGRCIGDRIYDEVLPEVCARLDPTRPYWPGSPWGGADANSEQEGDRHAWDVSIGAPSIEERTDYTRYALDRGKFVSEFGILAPPSLDSLRRYLPGDQLRRGSEMWESHNNRFEKGTNQEALRRYWRPADEMSLDDYVRFSQMIQAEALKFALEHWRRRKFDTAGALFWMFADCWGEVGWTVVDYYLARKRSYYAVKRAFAPVLVSLAQEEEGVVVWLVSDLRRPVPGRLTAGLLNLRTCETRPIVLDAAAPANASERVATLDLPDGERDDWLAYARFERDGEVLSRNRLFLAGFGFNRLPLVPADVACAPTEDGAALVLKSSRFAWMVHLDAPRGVWVEDNDFDLLPGEVRRVCTRGPRELLGRVTARPLNDA